ncbi:acyl-CoA dehydrogenase [Candidatus Marinamargulisbacteria bacterium SCGC AG-343-D04]|nr:acyl-CoA dehydrogenase [Candidatus Marinamargulisbacteria bacterium SCGC AG-343-D04]
MFFLQTLSLSTLIVLGVGVFGFLIYHGVSFWFISALIMLSIYSLGGSSTLLGIVFAGLLLLNLSIIRRYILSFPIYVTLKALKFLPTISQTEKEAIEAGTVWMDAELFSGYPDFKKILAQSYPRLQSEEEQFLEGPTEELCKLVKDWEVYQNRDFPQEVWDYFKKEKFFGLIIPKEYGGLGFSASGNSAIIGKLGSRSAPLGITVMVPNSLGPAELLVHYGTQAQKDYYLPRLANGEEIPCFALTEPNAGSDAGAMTSSGTVFTGEDGQPWIRLNWNKRYITLAAKATLLGLAFKLSDPDHILGEKEDIGITCALIPGSTKGVVVGRRHDPLGVPFFNCPTQGKDVEVPLSAVIGEREGLGKGWKMLMECLAAGRGISLPANCSSGAKTVARVVGAYSMIRKQFGLEIGKFEGIQEQISEISGMSYIMEAARKYTCGGIDQGAKPAVVTALAKYHFTEMFRQVITRGMDVVGGAGISLGPRNLLGHSFIASPIGVTVEGANILTRTLIIFGQGAIRCHPYILDEIHGIEDNDIARFDKGFWGHQAHIVRNLVRMTFLNLTRGFLVIPPRWDSTARYYQKLTWASAKFACYSDIALIFFGGGLKIKERVTARFGDVLSWMYLSSAVLKRFDTDGRLKEDIPLMKWSLQYAFSNMQTAFQELCSNMGLLFYISGLITRFNPLGSYPKDSLSAKVAKCIQKPGHQRDRLTEGIFLSDDLEDALGRLDHAFKVISSRQYLYKKLQVAIKKRVLTKMPIRELIDAAVKEDVLTKQEAQELVEAEDLRDDVVKVDDFSQDEYMQTSV